VAEWQISVVSLSCLDRETGPYETVYIGGTPSNVPTSANVPANILGIARSINIGDSNKNDTAVVFNGLSYFSSDPAIAQVIAHETGHILGLQHVNDPTQLMWPFGSPTATAIGGPTPIGQIVNGVVVSTGGTQDSNALLNCFVGASNTLLKTCAGLAGYSPLAFSTTDTEPTLYDVQIIIDNGTTDADTGPMIFDVGTLLADTNESIFLPDELEDIAVEGALSEGGQLLTLESDFVTGPNGPTLSISGVQTTPVPEPGSLMMMLSFLGPMGLIWRIRYRQPQLVL